MDNNRFSTELLHHSPDVNIISFSIWNALINKMCSLISEILLVSNTHRQNEIIKSEFEVEYCAYKIME